MNEVRAEKESHELTLKEETWSKNSDPCCSINKVEPLDKLKNKFTIWVSGLMAWQSKHRSNLDIFEERNGILKFYPLLDVSREERGGLLALITYLFTH